MESEFEMSVRQFLARPPFSLRGLSSEDLAVFCAALTHDSYSNEARDAGLPPVQCYERLEFLGDAVVEFLVCEAAYSDDNRGTEGSLTDFKIASVRNEHISDMVLERGVGIDGALRVGNGLLEGGAKQISPKMRADSFEALVAALYLTRGMDAAKDLVGRVLLRPPVPCSADRTC